MIEYKADTQQYPDEASTTLCHFIRVQMSIAAALVSLKVLPPKLNPVIRPLMETIKKENYYFFQVNRMLGLNRIISLTIWLKVVYDDYLCILLHNHIWPWIHIL